MIIKDIVKEIRVCNGQPYTVEVDYSDDPDGKVVGVVRKCKPPIKLDDKFAFNLPGALRIQDLKKTPDEINENNNNKKVENNNNKKVENNNNEKIDNKTEIMNEEIKMAETLDERAIERIAEKKALDIARQREKDDTYNRFCTDVSGIKEDVKKIVQYIEDDMEFKKHIESKLNNETMVCDNCSQQGIREGFEHCPHCGRELTWYEEDGVIPVKEKKSFWR